VAQLYEQEFKTQEKAKYEHIKQAKEKAIEEQRAEADRIEREQEVSLEVVPNTATNGNIGTNWSSVSPEIAANYIASKTGVGASKWLDVIYKESSGNPYVENPIGCWGLLQINQSVHGQVSNLSPQAYLDKAVSIYQGSGGTAWATW
jgi:soluble lytic murein transglycosylase-like protein